MINGGRTLKQAEIKRSRFYDIAEVESMKAAGDDC
jgi:hypothetical protein